MHLFSAEAYASHVRHGLEFHQFSTAIGWGLELEGSDAMPLVRIEIIKGRGVTERKRLLQGVHAALVEAFGIPEDDRTQRLIEHDSENFEIPPGHSENYTLVEITAFPGRSSTAKRALWGSKTPSRLRVVRHGPLILATRRLRAETHRYPPRRCGARTNTTPPAS